MKKTITIDGREVTLVANALTPRLYRHKFGRDMIRAQELCQGRELAR